MHVLVFRIIHCNVFVLCVCVSSLDKMLESLHRLRQVNDQLSNHKHTYEVRAY